MCNGHTDMVNKCLALYKAEGKWTILNTFLITLTH